jgi:hypothetical protein
MFTRIGMMISFMLMVVVNLYGEEAKQDSSKALEIKEVKESRDNYLTSLNVVIGNYIKILNKEEENQTKKGDLDILEKIKKEKTDVNILEPVSSSVDWAKNKVLVAGLKSFNNSLEKSKKDYISKLEAIQRKLVQDKKIDLAKMVRDYIIEQGFIGKRFVWENKYSILITSATSIVYMGDDITEKSVIGKVVKIEENQISVEFSWSANGKKIHTFKITSPKSFTGNREDGLKFTGKIES